MLFRTHLACALFLSLLLVDQGFVKASILFFASAILFSLVPDLDTPESFLGRRIRPLSNLFQALLGHRTLLHSLWFPLLLSSVALGWNIALGLGLLVGYGSHLLLDLLSEKGLLPLWPFNFHLSGPFHTGGLIEHLLFVVLIILSLLLMMRLLF